MFKLDIFAQKNIAKRWEKTLSQLQQETDDLAKKEGERCVKMVETAYKLASGSIKSDAYQQLIQELKEEGWEVLSRSCDDESTNQYGYKAIAFVNHNTGKVRIATAGTKPTEKYDLWDDFKLFAGSLPLINRLISRVPNKLQPAQRFLDRVIEQLAGKQYTFGTCGHSLGSIMSDLTAAEILSRGLKNSSSITFENPGSQKVVEQAFKDQLIRGKGAEILEQLKEQSTEYNAVPNFINRSGHRLAKKIRVLVKSPRPVAESSGKLVDAFTAVQQQLEDHRLGNFSGLKQTFPVASDWDEYGGLRISSLPGTFPMDKVRVNEHVEYSDDDNEDLIIMTKEEAVYVY